MLACSHSMKFGAAIAGAAIILGGTSVDGARSTLRSSRQGSLSALGAAQARTTKGVPADVAKKVPERMVGDCCQRTKRAICWKRWKGEAYYRLFR